MKEKEKRYLNWPQKIAYGSGDLAANCTYGMITAFVMIYLTDTVGLNPGVIGILIGVSKLLDGITDVFFGSLIDRTKNKMGKARPWMLWSQIGVSACLFLVFFVPMGISENIQYAYFFVTYTSLNAIFYTANNIAYASLTALITKNVNERVQLGSIRFMFSLATNMIVQSVTVGFVADMGGGAAGWRNVAFIYAVIGLAVNTFSCLMVKELPEEEEATAGGAKKEHISLLQSAKYLLTNKYYVIILFIYLFQYSLTGITGSAGIYFMTYVLGDPALLGTFSMAGMLPMIASLALTPILVKWAQSMWKVNTIGFVISLFFNVAYVFAALNLNVPLMLAMAFMKGLCTGPMTGTLNALIAEASAYTQRTRGVHLEGTMYSCSSLGIKLGGGLGSVLAGLLLDIGGYDGMAAQQTAGAISMIKSMYIFIPFGVAIIMTVLVYLLKVEKANKKWDEEHGITAE